MTFGFGPYTLLFTFQTVASQLVYQQLKRPSKCSLVKNQIFPIWKFLGVLLSNTLKRINTNFPTKPPKKFLLVILRIPKHTYCTILTLKRLRFLATSPSMRLLLILLLRTQSKHPSISSRKDGTETFLQKPSFPVLPAETMNDFENETTSFPRWCCFIWKHWCHWK